MVTANGLLDRLVTLLLINNQKIATTWQGNVFAGTLLGLGTEAIRLAHVTPSRWPHAASESMVFHVLVSIL